MPLFRFDITDTRTDEQVTALLDAAYAAQEEALQTVPGDRYQVVHAHPAAHLRIEDTGLGIARTDAFVLIQVTTSPRSQEQKTKLYDLLVRNLERDAGIAPSDVMVVVGVTGDLAAATKAIRTVFKDNLCVVHSDLTDAEVQKQQSAVDAALDWSKLGVTSITQTQKALGVPGPTEINVIVDTPELEKVLSTIAGPPLRVVPWIQPIT